MVKLAGTGFLRANISRLVPEVGIWFADFRVERLTVDQSGRVYLLFDSSQPFWGGKVPDVKWPE